MRMRFKILNGSLLALLLLLPATSRACRILERSYFTSLLGRMENYLLILPESDVAISGAVYFLHGRNGDRHFIADLGGCQEVDRIARKWGRSFLIAAPDGGNGYWVNAAKTPERYRDLVAHELITRVEAEFPELPRTPKKRVIAGISMGGHGAIQVSINAPGIFGAVGAHSPVFRTQSEVLPDFEKQFGTGVAYQSRDPFSLILVQGKTFLGPVYLDMGARDPWITNTSHFQELLQKLKVPGIYKVGTDPSGGHANGYWHYHLGEYFDWYAEKIL